MFVLSEVFMSKKCILVCGGVMVLWLMVVGCASNGAASRQRLLVRDALTKQPVPWAQVELAWDGARQYSWTDAQGVASFDKQTSFFGVLGPRMEKINVKMGGYVPVSLQLTGAIPHEIEITPIQSRK